MWSGWKATYAPTKLNSLFPKIKILSSRVLYWSHGPNVLTLVPLRPNFLEGLIALDRQFILILILSIFFYHENVICFLCLLHTWVKIFRITPEFKILRLTFHRREKSNQDTYRLLPWWKYCWVHFDICSRRNEKIIFFFLNQNMLWVLRRTVSMRRFFWAPNNIYCYIPYECLL